MSPGHHQTYRLFRIKDPCHARRFNLYSPSCSVEMIENLNMFRFHPNIWVHKALISPSNTCYRETVVLMLLIGFVHFGELRSLASIAQWWCFQELSLTGIPRYIVIISSLYWSSSTSSWSSWSSLSSSSSSLSSSSSSSPPQHHYCRRNQHIFFSQSLLCGRLACCLNIRRMHKIYSVFQFYICLTRNITIKIFFMALS